MIKTLKIAIFLIVFICQVTPQQSIIPKKSPNDKNQYEALILKNKLKILFVYDKQAEKSSCSILIGVGSAYNPIHAPGLAHFLQHMVFMGSKKYPSTIQFSNFVKANSGVRNANTGQLQTNFFFQIKNDAFKQAVQRIVDFFVQSLIKQTQLQKQRKAVHNEFSLGLVQDANRKNQVLKIFAEPPYSIFIVGNNETLDYPSVREDLIKFYNQYYSSNIMSVVVYSNQPLSQIKQKMIPIFEQIPNREAKQKQFKVDFQKQNLRKLVRIQSVKDQKIMDIYWVVEHLLKYYKTHLSEYISYVASSQVPGSLRTILIDNGYISAITISVGNMIAQSSILVSVRLTEPGFQKYQLVYNIILDYMESIRFQRYIYEEIKVRNNLQFEAYQKPSSISDNAKNLASIMNKISLEQILNFTALFQQFQVAEKTANKILDQLRQGNLIVLLSSKMPLQNPKQQKYYKTKYTYQGLPTRMSSGYKYISPKPNGFLPIDTKIINITRTSNEPRKLAQNIYLLQDSSFNVSRGGIQLRIYGTEDYQFLNFYSNYLNLALKQYLDPAENLKTAVSFSSANCLIISVFGFNDIAIKIIQKTIQSVFILQYGPRNKNIFDVTLKAIIDSYSNFYTKRAAEVASEILTMIQTKGFNLLQKQLQTYKMYKYYEFLLRVNRFWVRTFTKWVFVGNFQEQAVKKLTKKIQNILNVYGVKFDVIQFNIIKLDKNIVYQKILDNESGTSCALRYYQLGPFSQRLNYQVLLLKQMIDQPYFDKLRTQKQLAYSLGVIYQNTRGILGLRFYLVSATLNPKAISEEIKQFVNKFYGQMDTYLTQNNGLKLKQIKKSLITNKAKPIKSIAQLFTFVIDQTKSKTFLYNSRNLTYVSNIIESITVEELQDTWKRMSRYTFEVYIVAKNHLEEYKKYNIQAMSEEQIKSKSQYYPDLLRQK